MVPMTAWAGTARARTARRTLQSVSWRTMGLFLWRKLIASGNIGRIDLSASRWMGRVPAPGLPTVSPIGVEVPIFACERASHGLPDEESREFDGAPQAVYGR